MNAVTSRSPVLVLLILISSCSGTADNDSLHSFHIFTENGVTIAETTGGPKYEGELFYYEEILKLNQDENVIESLLTQPTIVLMDNEGGLIVVDSFDRILRFDSSGNYSFNIGRQGEGPGEFRLPMLEYVQQGLLCVRDFRLHRISWYQTDGTFIDSSPLPSPSRMTVQRFSLGPNDERILLGDYQRGFGDEYRHNTAVAVVYSATGDSLASVTSDSVKVSRFFTTSGSGSGSASVHFSSWPRVLYHPNHGLVMATGLEPVFRCFTLDGQLNREIRLDIPPESVSSAEREAVRTYLRNRVLEAEDDRSRATREGQLEHIEFQDPKAFFSLTYICEYGYLWAAKPNINYITYPSGNSPVTLMLFNPDGEYLGDTQLPVGYRRITGDHVVSIQEDEETGVMDVVVYSMRPIVSGLDYPH